MSLVFKKRGGFTIIEVVLVLAIAGLIFLIVFIALPSLQKARRDTQRKGDLRRLIALVETYHGNTGYLPTVSTQIDDFINNYVDTANFFDPTEGAYDIQGLPEAYNSGHNVYPDLGQIYFKANHVCTSTNPGGPGNDQIQHAGASITSVAVWTLLENGGVICFDNR